MVATTMTAAALAAVPAVLGQVHGSVQAVAASVSLGLIPPGVVGQTNRSVSVPAMRADVVLLVPGVAVKAFSTTPSTKRTYRVPFESRTFVVRSRP